jgi:hypothetical protein
MLGGHDADYVRIVWLVASAFGIAVLVALAVLYRRAAKRAELEQAERIIAEHDHSTAPRASR